MSGSAWITSADAIARLGVKRPELYRLVDAEVDGRLRFDRERHAVVVPEDVVERLAARLAGGHS